MVERRSFLVTIVLAAFVKTLSGQLLPACQPPPGCLDPCFVEPICRAFPTATCSPYYCGGRCEAVFYINSRRMDCNFMRNVTTPMPQATVPIRVCPVAEDDSSNGTALANCLNQCSNCEQRGQICCPNKGCGSSCKHPVVWVPFSEPYVAPRDEALRKVPLIDPRLLFIRRCPEITQRLTITTCENTCNNCEITGKLCCSNGCGKECMTPV